MKEIKKFIRTENKRILKSKKEVSLDWVENEFDKECRGAIEDGMYFKIEDYFYIVTDALLMSFCKEWDEFEWNSKIIATADTPQELATFDDIVVIKTEQKPKLEIIFKGGSYEDGIEYVVSSLNGADIITPEMIEKIIAPTPTGYETIWEELKC